MPYKTKRKKRALSKSVLIAVAIVAIAIIAGYFSYKHYHHTQPPAAKTPGRSIYSKPESNQKVPGGTNPNDQSGISSSKGGQQSSPALSPGIQPSGPVGQFVSNHSPSLSGKPSSNNESSTCTTTPGAECQIRFTSGSTVKSLPAQATDTNGNVSWSWTLQSIGLTQGTWQVTAVASNGSKTASTTDAFKLTVGP